MGIEDVTIKVEVKANGNGSIVAYDGQRKVGHLTWYMQPDGTWVFVTTAVDDEYQGNGIGRRMTDKAKEYRESKGDAPWRRPPTTTAGTGLVTSHLRDHPDTRELTTNG